MNEIVAGLYAQVAAPAWAARNLDALADVLRDLSWLPEGPVELVLPDLSHLSPADQARLAAVLDDVTRETSGSRHPLHVLP